MATYPLILRLWVSMSLQCHWRKWSSLLPCWHKHSRSHYWLRAILTVSERVDRIPPPPLIPRRSFPPPCLRQTQHLCSCVVSWVSQGRWKRHREGRTAHFGCSTDLFRLKWLHYQSLAELNEKTRFNYKLISLSSSVYCMNTCVCSVQKVGRPSCECSGAAV